jgi:hypothetical protein
MIASASLRGERHAENCAPSWCQPLRFAARREFDSNRRDQPQYRPRRAMGYKRIGQSKFALPSLPRTAIVATRSSLDGDEKVAEIEA